MAPALILKAFVKALGQIGDRRLSGVFWLGIVLSLVLLALASAGVQALLLWWAGDGVTLPLIGEVTWFATLAAWSGPVAMIMFSVVLMVPVASAMSSLFLDRVADAVEARYYPQSGVAASVPFVDSLLDSAGFLGVMIAANIVALVLYLIFSPVALFIFWGLNGFLLGREYFTLVAIRHLGRAGAIEMRKRHSGTIWLAGVLMAMPLSVPLVNLAIPVLGAATFTHIYHGLRQNAGHAA
jgi:CysZ protein